MAKSADGEITYAPNLKGKKSWFMFENEIVCLGAGIQNKGMDLPVETTIENRRLGTDGENAFVVNGEEADLPIKEANIKELAEHSADVSGTEFDGAEGSSEGNVPPQVSDIISPEEGTSIGPRRARNTGNWMRHRNHRRRKHPELSGDVVRSWQESNQWFLQLCSSS